MNERSEVYTPKHRADVPVDSPSQATAVKSGNFLYDIFDRAEERNRTKFKPFEKSYCQGFEDGADGFVIHTQRCPNYQNSAMDDSNCINYHHDCHWPKGLAKIR